MTRSLRLYLPIAVCLAAIAGVVLTSNAHGLEGLLLIAGALLAIAVLDLFSRRAGRVGDDAAADDRPPPPPPRR